MTLVYIVAALVLATISTGPATLAIALLLFMVVMGTLGIGNGAVFQLVPQRFRQEIGVMTGLVGFAGGVGGFYLASSLGFAQKLTGSPSAGFLIFAGLALVGLNFARALRARGAAREPARTDEKDGSGRRRSREEDVPKANPRAAGDPMRN